LLLAGYGTYVLLQREEVKEDGVGGILAVEKTQQLITGYAYVSVLKFSTSDPKKSLISDDELAPEQSGAETLINRVTGMCHRFYAIALGYENVANAVEIYKAGAQPNMLPQMIAVHAVRAVTTGKFDPRKCDQMDLKSDLPERNTAIANRMTRDGLWRSHADQACEALEQMATLSERPAQKEGDKKKDAAGTTNQGGPKEANDAKVDGLGQRSGDKAPRINERRLKACKDKYSEATAELRIEPQKTQSPGVVLAHMQRDGNAVTHGRFLRVQGNGNQQTVPAFGRLGAVTVTVSAVGELSWDSQYWWLFKRQQFHVRRDIVRAIYGSDILDARWRFDPWQLKHVVRVTVGEPYLLARDSHTVLSVSTKNVEIEKLVDASGRSRAEALVRRLSDEALEAVQPAVIAASRQQTRRTLKELVGEAQRLEMEYR